MYRADAGPIARRPAYTLIELIVVIAIIAILSGLTVAFLTAFNGTTATAAQGASNVQNTLLTARSEALRSGRPYGVRFLRDPANGNQVNEMQFIQQPPDFFGGRAFVQTGALNIVRTPDVNLRGGFGANDPRCPVQVGDYIELRNSGQMRRITVVAANQVTVATAFPFPTVQSPVPAVGPKPNQFRIIRQPRVTGEEPILLPQDIIIDLKTNTDVQTLLGLQAPLPVNATDNCVDVLFSPSGQVIGSAVTDAPIFLWVRDSNQTLFSGDDTIIAVYPRSGMTAAHPAAALNVTAAAPYGTDPYSFARDGRSSGQ